ncbi:Mth938-like domain-containing protein, partial [Sphingomonas bacterium]|uniref:Mth938-like domain-containing protein n=1 Tax=Sphingomonas bacterium TaxID=1895847 RepID=UPI0015761B0F
MQVSRDQTGPGPIVTGFGPGGFRVGEERFRAVLLTVTDAVAWTPPPLDALGIDDLAPLVAARPEFILLGTGGSLRRPPLALTRALDAAGLGIEPMDSRAAARGWGVLRGEGRLVA